MPNIIKLRSRKAVYAGSFDPLTNGHIDIIHGATELFDELVIAIGNNPDKKYTFCFEDRLTMLQETMALFQKEWCGSSFTADCSGQVVETTGCKVTIDYFENQYLVVYANQVNADFLVRGIRNEDDYLYEREMAFFNQDSKLHAAKKTVWLPCRRNLSGVSSSFVKGLCGPEFWQMTVQTFVPLPVFKHLLAWKGCPNWTDQVEEKED
jgi:pantetheine-phosphate adenylyltransferase